MSKEKKEEVSAKDILSATISNVQKKFGKSAIITDQDYFPEVSYLPSGSIGLDLALNGGYGRGRITEIIGPESSGKTTMALHAIASAQEQEAMCAFIDMEHAIDMSYAEALGVRRDLLIICQPDSAEQALGIMEELTRSKQFAVIVLDSVAALVPQAEIEGEMGASHVGLQARLMSQAMRKLNSIAMSSNTCLIFINQIRLKIGVMYGSPETTSGGLALKFYSSQRLDVRRIATLGGKDDKYGNTTRVKVIKNKIGPPFKEVEIDIIFGKGIAKTVDLIRVATKKEVIDKGGAWYSFQGQQLGQGETKAAAFLDENPELRDQIRILVMPSRDKPREPQE